EHNRSYIDTYIHTYTMGGKKKGSKNVTKGITKKEKPVIPRLLDDDDDFFLPKVEDALREIFGRYDSNKDGALSLAELNQFAVKCNGKPFDKDSIDAIQEAFSCNDKGELTITGFLEMYCMQSMSEPEETWRDITAHGYNSNVELKTAEESAVAPSSSQQAAITSSAETPSTSTSTSETTPSSKTTEDSNIIGQLETKVNNLNV
ncbi:hypothetical protein SAMD00019534_005600, partial [Acytostelium subglobosum LB1]|uniref:hypothetical protein n=1 Tax=Acytostelium subglobosum LB1 TaxID=1410327 RepID=UPI0006448A1C